MPNSLLLNLRHYDRLTQGSLTRISPLAKDPTIRAHVVRVQGSSALIYKQSFVGPLAYDCDSNRKEQKDPVIINLTNKKELQWRL